MLCCAFRRRLSGEHREALGRKSEKANGRKDLGAVAKFPEHFVKRVNRSEEIAQGLEPASSSTDFGSDS